MAYAIIKTGGKQYRVSTGTRLTVEKLVGEVGEHVEFAEVLLRGSPDGIDIGRPLLEGASVKGIIVHQGRGPRISVYKKKRRKNYRRHQGHRQWETTVEVTAVD